MRMRPSTRPTWRSNAARTARDEGGFTMIVTLVVLVTTGLLMAAAFAAANGDIHLTQTDSNAKKAYYAAQAGISQYVYHLNQDINYWTYCTGGSAASNHALNQAGSTVHRVPVQGASEEEYAIELLPASTNKEAEPKCNSASPVSSMVEAGSNFGGTFRVESTGFSGNQKRSIVATFGHKGFLEFIYYTKYETLDPVTYSPPRPQCAAPYGTRPAPPTCEQIDFIGTDHINGPFHTQDNAAICNEPTFGRKSSDSIEFLHGWRSAGCSGTNEPKFLGTDVTTNLKSIEPPPSDTTLKTVVESAYNYSGKTALVLGGTTMKVTHYSEEPTLPHNITTTVETNVPYPANGLIYVSSNSGSCGTYDPRNPNYTGDVHCGNVYVEGNNTGQLTIAAENDIIIDGNLTTPVNSEKIPTTNAVLGLVANNFVRVYHPETSSEVCSTALNELTIYAAILAVNHSFIVDNFDCKPALKELYVYGAIAQIFRGTVGTHNGAELSSGYSKNYNYDDRLTTESPPYFLSPIAAAWIIKRETAAE